MRKTTKRRIKNVSIITGIALAIALSVSTVTYALNTNGNIFGFVASTETEAATEIEINLATEQNQGVELAQITADSIDASTESLQELDILEANTETEKVYKEESTETSKEVKKETSTKKSAGTTKPTEAEEKTSQSTEEKTTAKSTEVTQSTQASEQSSQQSTEQPAQETAQAPAQQEAAPVAEATNIYKYCPTNMNGNVLYCSNEAEPGTVKDGICIGGTRVLTTTPGSWDSVQVCDPSVVAGSFSFNGGTYTYLMAYLGCATYDCTANEIGFAVSNDLYNWVKVGKVVSAAYDGFWGVGQPSIMNLSNDGNVLLFYTSGTASKTTTYCKKLACSNLNAIADLGTVEITCAYDFISNGDFAYSNGTLFMTCDTHPYNPGPLSFISDQQSIYQAAWDGNFESLGSLNWGLVTRISSANTGYAKNHNGCFVRDSYGNLAARQVMVSTATEVNNDFLTNLFTYRFMTVGF